MEYYLVNKDQGTLSYIGADIARAILKAKHGLSGDEVHEAREPGAGLVQVWPEQGQKTTNRGAPRKNKEDRRYKVQLSVSYDALEALTREGKPSVTARRIIEDWYQKGLDVLK